MKRLFIINPVAGAGRACTVWEALQPALRQRKLEGDHLITTKPGDALESTANAADKYHVVVAVGGDGTVFEIVSGLLAAGQTSSNSTLGIIPCGTGNDIAHSFGIASPHHALQALTGKSASPVDTIAITCQNSGTTIQRHALLFAAVGIVGPLLRFTTPLAKRILGRSTAYRFAALSALLSYRAPSMRVECDHGTFSEPFVYIGAHNTESFGGGMRAAPGANPGDGLMNLNLISAVGALEALLHFRRLCRGTHIDHPRVRYFTGRTLSIQSTPAADVAADGDLIGLTPAVFSIAPKSLTVFTPAAGG